MEDRYTHTEADAAAFERHRSGGLYDDRPSASDLADDGGCTCGARYEEDCVCEDEEPEPPPPGPYDDEPTDPYEGDPR